MDSVKKYSSLTRLFLQNGSKQISTQLEAAICFAVFHDICTKQYSLMLHAPPLAEVCEQQAC